ncbi:DddA-like double-stranded DNA deaminase toxin [Kribbella sp. NPDC002412]
MVSGARTPEGGSPDQSGVDRVRRIAPDTVEGILQRLPVRDESKATPDKTRGLWIDSDGNEEELVSGYDRYSADADEYVTREKLVPPPHSLRIASHVEIKFAMMMRERGLTNETIVINNRPCRRPWGCNVLLPYFLPKGTSLTVYDQDGFGKTYRGRGKP